MYIVECQDCSTWIFKDINIKHLTSIFYWVLLLLPKINTHPKSKLFMNYSKMYGFILNIYHKKRFVHVGTQNIVKPVFFMLLEKSSITNKVTLIKNSLSGYAVLNRLKMIGSKIKHCKGRMKIKMLKLRNIKVASESHLWTPYTLNKTEFQEWYKSKYAICLHYIIMCIYL